MHKDKGQENKSFWNKVSGFYDLSVRSSKKGYSKVIDKIRHRLKQDMNVLELATATGIIGIGVAHYCKTIMATDFSEKMIKKACRKKKPENLQYAVEDATDLSFGDNVFDVVIISNALHIMPDPAAALNNIKRVLKPDGVMIAPTFTRSDNTSEGIKEKLMEIVGFKTHHRWTFDSYISFLEDNGWQIVESSVIKASFPIAYVVAKY